MKRSFSFTDDLSAHEKLHNTLKCDFCDIYFESKNDLIQHMSVHSQRNSIFHCNNKCTKSYANMEKLRRHDWRVLKEINCTVCGKILQNREKISDNRKLEHWMFKKSKFKFFLT